MRSDLLSRLFALMMVEQGTTTDPATGFATRATLRADARTFRAYRHEDASLMVIAFSDAMPAGFPVNLRSLLHVADTPYRLSSREIAVLMPATSLRRAVGLAEHVRVVSEVEVRAPGAISIGLATTDACGFDLDALLASADGAAREARARGGNRIVVAEPPAWRPRQAAAALSA